MRVCLCVCVCVCACVSSLSKPRARSRAAVLQERKKSVLCAALQIIRNWLAPAVLGGRVGGEGEGFLRAGGIIPVGQAALLDCSPRCSRRNESSGRWYEQKAVR